MALFTKESQDFHRHLRERASKKHILVDVHFELTYKCNLNCLHCYNKCIKDNRKKELEFKEVCSILDQLKSMGCLSICFTGGELFTRNDALDILSHARTKAGFLIRIFTNATLITPTIADRIRELLPTSVAVSLYGASEKSYEEFTGSANAFNQAVKGIKLLVNRDIQVNLRVVISKSNIDELPSMENLVKSLKVNSVQYGVFMLRDAKGSFEPLKYEIPFDLACNLVLRHYHLEKQKNPELFLPKRKNGPRFSACKAGYSICAISPYGEAFPCLLFKVKGTGLDWPNLRKESFLEIWQSHIFKELRSFDFPNLPECRNCELKNFCTICYAEYYIGNYNKQSSTTCRNAYANKVAYDFIHKKDWRRLI